jgi:hypothetical protein
MNDLKSVAVRQRGNCLTCLDKINAKESIECASCFIMVNAERNDEHIQELINILLINYLMIHVEKPRIPYPVRNRYFRRACNIDTSECRILFRFDQQELFQLIQCWRVPENIVCSNRSVFNGEEAFLMMLARLASPTRFITMESFWGRDNTQICRCFNTALNYFVDLHREKVTNNLEYWKRYFAKSNEKIKNKIRSLGYPILEQAEFCCGFFDCTIRPCCKPQGKFKMIYDCVSYKINFFKKGQENIQLSVYNGKNKVHALKYLALSLSNFLFLHFEVLWLFFHHQV